VNRCLFEQISWDEDISEEKEMQVVDHHVTSVAESDVTTQSDVSIPEDISDEDKMQKPDPDIQSIPESDITTASEVSVCDEIQEVCTKNDFDSDGTTISDIGEEDDLDFSQWTDSMDALVASFDVTAESMIEDISQKSCEGSKTISTLGSPVNRPCRSGGGTVRDNVLSPMKRPLDLTSDTVQGPPSVRQRQLFSESVADDGQIRVSPLRKTLSATLSLQMS